MGSELTHITSNSMVVNKTCSKLEIKGEDKFKFYEHAWRTRGVRKVMQLDLWAPYNSVTGGFFCVISVHWHLIEHPLNLWAQIPSGVAAVSSGSWAFFSSEFRFRILSHRLYFLSFSWSQEWISSRASKMFAFASDVHWSFNKCPLKFITSCRMSLEITVLRTQRSRGGSMTSTLCRGTMWLIAGD